MERPVDPLFEFDAPQMFVDLTRALHDYAPPLEKQHQDPWFDAVHPEHSRPSDELARQAHAAVRARSDKAAAQTPGRVLATAKRRDSAVLLKDKVPSAESAQDPSDKENQDVFDRRPRADMAPRRMPMRMLRTKAAPVEKAGDVKPSTKAAVKTVVVSSKRVAAQKTEKQTVGLKRKTDQPRNRSLTSELTASSSKPGRQPRTTSAVSIRSATATSARVVAANSGSVRKPGKPSEKSDLRDLEELLAQHNKKFKPTHTYEPPQHSVRDVKAWERQTNQSYYKLTSEGRVKANQEIAAWLESQQQRTN